MGITKRAVWFRVGAALLVAACGDVAAPVGDASVLDADGTPDPNPTLLEFSGEASHVHCHRNDAFTTVCAFRSNGRFNIQTFYGGVLYRHTSSIRDSVDKGYPAGIYSSEGRIRALVSVSGSLGVPFFESADQGRSWAFRELTDDCFFNNALEVSGRVLLSGRCPNPKTALADWVVVEPGAETVNVLDRVEADIYGAALRAFFSDSAGCVWAGGHVWKTGEIGPETHLVIRRSCDGGTTWHTDWEDFEPGRAWRTAKFFGENDSGLYVAATVPREPPPNDGLIRSRLVLFKRFGPMDWRPVDFPASDASDFAFFGAFGPCRLVSVNVLRHPPPERFEVHESLDCGSTWDLVVAHRHNAYSFQLVLDDPAQPQLFMSYGHKKLVAEVYPLSTAP